MPMEALQDIIERARTLEIEMPPTLELGRIDPGLALAGLALFASLVVAIRAGGAGARARRALDRARAAEQRADEVARRLTRRGGIAEAPLRALRDAPPAAGPVDAPRETAPKKFNRRLREERPRFAPKPDVAARLSARRASSPRRPSPRRVMNDAAVRSLV
ncbi:MAG: hypothetical protein AAF527_01910 [Pseudomonadota bacterium]